MRDCRGKGRKGTFNIFKKSKKIAVLIAALAVLICVCRQNPIFGYTHIIFQENTRNEVGAVVKWKLNGFPGNKIPYLINPNRPKSSSPVLPAGVTTDEIIRDIQNGFQAWENVGSSVAAFSFDGLSTQAGPAVDGTNLATMAADPLGEGDCGTAFTRVVACLEVGLCRLPNGKFVNVDFPGQIVDADLVFCNGENSESLSIDGSGDSDVQARATHEVGHFLGLAHSGILPATMYGYVSYDNVGIANRSRQTLGTDDVIAISSLYPVIGFFAETGSISGSVADVDLNPVFGAQVVASDFDGIAVASAITGVNTANIKGVPETFSLSSGDYVINGLPPGNYDLFVEPLDGPPAGATNFGFFSIDNINVNFQTTLFPHTVTVDPGSTRSGVDFGVLLPLDPLSPNIDVLTLTDVPSGIIASGVAFFGESNNIRVGLGSNIVSAGKIPDDTVFEISGKGVNISSPPFVSGNFINLPVSISSGIPIGPRNILVNTSKGVSALAGGLIVTDAPPLASSISPDFGPTGTIAVIKGRGFLPDTIVSVNGKAVSSVVVNGAGDITISVPDPFSTRKKTADIEVHNDAGSSVLKDAFFYTEDATPSPEPTPSATSTETETEPTATATETSSPSESPVLSPSPTESPVETPPVSSILSSLSVDPVVSESSVKFKTATVTALDHAGLPVRSLVVRAEQTGIGVAVWPKSAATNPNGEAKFKFRFKRNAGNAELIFTAAGLSATISQ